MGNYFYAETLIGMTVKRAEIYIKENTVYLDANHTKYKISEIRIIYPKGMYTKDYCLNRLEVRTENNVIIEILGSG